MSESLQSRIRSLEKQLQPSPPPDAFDLYVAGDPVTQRLMAEWRERVAAMRASGEYTEQIKRRQMECMQYDYDDDSDVHLAMLDQRCMRIAALIECRRIMLRDPDCVTDGAIPKQFADELEAMES